MCKCGWRNELGHSACCHQGSQTQGNRNTLGAEGKLRQLERFQLWRWLDIKSRRGPFQFIASFSASACSQFPRGTKWIIIFLASFVLYSREAREVSAPRPSAFCLLEGWIACSSSTGAPSPTCRPPLARQGSPGIPFSGFCGRPHAATLLAMLVFLLCLSKLVILEI